MSLPQLLNYLRFLLASLVFKTKALRVFLEIVLRTQSLHFGQQIFTCFGNCFGGRPYCCGCVPFDRQAFRPFLQIDSFP